MSIKISKPVSYALDALGAILLITALYAIGTCGIIGGTAFDDIKPIFSTAHAQDVPPAAETQSDAERARLARQEEMELEQTRAALQQPEVGAVMPHQDSDEAAMSGSIQEGDAWTPLEVAIAQLSIHEGSGRDTDTVAITSARGGWSLERLRREHPRALSATGHGTRPWIAGLNAELTRPEAWDESRMPWVGGGQRIWLRTLQNVRRTLEGQMRCPGGTPQIWGGRSLDHSHIERRLAQGFRVVDCGTTANVYLRRDRAAAR